MVNLRLFFIALLYLIITPSNAQSLSAHQWKDRLVVIYSKDYSNRTFQNQVQELQKDQEGILDRKIIVYQSVQQKVKQGLDGSGSWSLSAPEYQKLIHSSASFEVLLIGLDGSVKLRKSELMTTQQLFEAIDQMPMRLAEMRRKKDN